MRALAEHIVDAILGEAVVRPNEDEIQEIIRIIQSSDDINELNQQLAPYGVSIEDNPEIKTANAPGGYTGDKMVINPAWLWQLQRWPDYLYTLVSHELVHKGQADRIRAAGKDPVEISQQIADRYLRQGGRTADTVAYTEEPIEAMPLALNAVNAYRQAGKDVGPALRSGEIKRFSPVPISPGKGRRFMKYAAKYAS